MKNGYRPNGPDEPTPGYVPDMRSSVQPPKFAAPSLPFLDNLMIRRVANGWVIHSGSGRDECTHVATTPQELAAHVVAWASATTRRNNA